MPVPTAGNQSEPILSKEDDSNDTKIAGFCILFDTVTELLEVAFESTASSILKTNKTPTKNFLKNIDFSPENIIN